MWQHLWWDFVLFAFATQINALLEYIWLFHQWLQEGGGGFQGFQKPQKFWLLIGTTIDHHPEIYKQQTIMCLAVQIHTGSGKVLAIGSWNLIIMESILYALKNPYQDYSNKAVGYIWNYSNRTFIALLGNPHLKNPDDNRPHIVPCCKLLTAVQLPEHTPSCIIRWKKCMCTNFVNRSQCIHHIAYKWCMVCSLTSSGKRSTYII